MMIAFMLQSTIYPKNWFYVRTIQTSPAFEKVCVIKLKLIRAMLLA